MPQYVVKNLDTQVVSELPLMSWDDLQTFLSDNVNYEQVLTKPAFVKVN
jgi:hypothetical protein